MNGDLETFVPLTFQRRGNRQLAATETPAHDTPLLEGLGRARYWQRLLDEGKYRSIAAIAAAEGIDLGQVSRIARLTQLAPDIVDACAANGERTRRRWNN